MRIKYKAFRIMFYDFWVSPEVWDKVWNSTYGGLKYRQDESFKVPSVTDAYYETKAIKTSWIFYIPFIWKEFCLQLCWMCEDYFPWAAGSQNTINDGFVTSICYSYIVLYFISLFLCILLEITNNAANLRERMKLFLLIFEWFLSNCLTYSSLGILKTQFTAF